MKKNLILLFIVVGFSIFLTGCNSNSNTNKNSDKPIYEEENEFEEENEAKNNSSVKFYTNFDETNMIKLTFDDEYIKVEEGYTDNILYDFTCMFVDEKYGAFETSLSFSDSYSSKEEYYNAFIKNYENKYTNVKGSEITTSKHNGIVINKFSISYDWESTGINKETGKEETTSGTSTKPFYFIVLDNKNIMSIGISNKDEEIINKIFDKLFVKIETIK